MSNHQTAGHLSLALPCTSSRPLYCAAGVIGGVAVLVFLAALLLEHRIEPIARQRIISSLEAKYHSPVELDEVSVSLRHGLQVDGKGLRIMAIGNHERVQPGGSPMLVARQFQFASSLSDLLLHHESAITAYVQGLVISIPAANDRKLIQQSDPRRAAQARDSLFLNRLIATNSTLILESSNPTKPPITFDFNKLILFDPGKDRPFTFETILENPAPVGEIHSTGHFGPWNHEDPGQTPLDGNFTFEHADLSTLTGLSGMLSAAGGLNGTLSQIQVRGSTEAPDFAFDLSSHPVALHTDFEALVDGTTSAVALQSVTARFLHTTLESNGLISRAAGVPGHHIALDFRLKQGRSEDLLLLFTRSQPLVKSTLTLSGHLDVPPGKSPLALRMVASGRAALAGTTFSNPATQQQVDSLSLRAQDVHLARQAIDHPSASPLVSSSMTGAFIIRDGNIDVTGLLYKMPGATLLMQGRFPLKDRELEFHGVARTVASASQLESGWKSILLKPVSPFLRKGRAGMQIPVSLTGDKAHPVFALDLKHPFDDKPGVPASPAP